MDFFHIEAVKMYFVRMSENQCKRTVLLYKIFKVGDELITDAQHSGSRQPHPG